MVMQSRRQSLLRPALVTLASLLAMERIQRTYGY
jgi:hypothetical protein